MLVFLLNMKGSPCAEVRRESAKLGGRLRGTQRKHLRKSARNNQGIDFRMTVKLM